MTGTSNGKIVDPLDLVTPFGHDSDEPYEPVLSTNCWDLPTLDTSDPGPLKTSTLPHSISNLRRNPTLPLHLRNDSVISRQLYKLSVAER